MAGKSKNRNPVLMMMQGLQTAFPQGNRCAHERAKSAIPRMVLVLLIGLLGTPVFSLGQKPMDTANKLNIEILPSGGTNLQYIQTDSGAINKLINNVQLRQGDTYMYCDSAYVDLAKNNMQAFSNVRIVQTDGTRVESDYLRYIGNTKKAYLRGNVALTDGKANLWSEDLYYDVGTRIGTYSQGGTLQNDTTTLSSNSGMYNARTKDARFTGEVFVTNPQYNVVSDDLGYNTRTEVVIFYGKSVVTNDQSELRTSSGTWDALQKIAHFTTRSSLQDNAQYIEADQIDYNRNTGFGMATGNVISIDTAQKLTLYSGHAQYNEITKQLYTTRNPVMKKMNGEDSLFIRADTFYSAPVVKIDTMAIDTVQPSRTVKSKLRTQEEDFGREEDSAVKRYFIGYHHVLIYSDSLQAICDSISYSQADSIMKLMYDPIAWSRNGQISGDTILLYTDSSRLKKIYVPNNALLVSQSGPAQAKLYDQVQGKTLTGYFEDNNIREMIVFPNAEFIHYSTDEEGAYIGVVKGESDKLRAIFEDRKISKVIPEQHPKFTMTPMQQAVGGEFRLSRFQWLIEKRPKSVQELFDYEQHQTQPEEKKETVAEPAIVVPEKKRQRRGRRK